MTADSSTGQAWTCPACSRQVPPRIDTCRCGHVREPLTASGDAEAATSWRIPPAAWVIGIAVVVLAFWMGYNTRHAGPTAASVPLNALNPLRTLSTVRTGKALNALDSLRAGRTLRTLRPRRALHTLDALYALLN